MGPRISISPSVRPFVMLSIINGDNQCFSTNYQHRTARETFRFRCITHHNHHQSPLSLPRSTYTVHIDTSPTRKYHRWPISPPGSTYTLIHIHHPLENITNQLNLHRISITGCATLSALAHETETMV